jgi:hypothetical protein
MTKEMQEQMARFIKKRGIPTPIEPSQEAIERIEEEHGPLSPGASEAERGHRFRLWQAETVFCLMVQAGEAERRPDGSVVLLDPPPPHLVK